jgi:uncharacterized damage-inducible protein DinB
MKTEIEALIQLIDGTRKLVHFALKKIEDRDLRKRFEIEGRKINSVYWLIAHMAWAENNLLLRSTSGPNPALPWLKHFALGKPAEEGEINGPSWEEVKAGFKKVHELSMKHLETLDPALLDSPNNLDWEIMGGKTMRHTIMHHIRHENNHTGQLLLIVNLYGVKTI